MARPEEGSHGALLPPPPLPPPPLVCCPQGRAPWGGWWARPRALPSSPAGRPAVCTTEHSSPRGGRRTCPPGQRVTVALARAHVFDACVLQAQPNGRVEEGGLGAIPQRPALCGCAVLLPGLAVPHPMVGAAFLRAACCASAPIKGSPAWAWLISGLLPPGIGHPAAACWHLRSLPVGALAATIQHQELSLPPRPAAPSMDGCRSTAALRSPQLLAGTCGGRCCW